jgi:PadR family transcriptional regulator PadR
MYGYQLSQEFRKRSNNRFLLLEGSMYPILYRLSDSGYISFYEKKIGKRQTRVYYHLEESGTSYLKQMHDEYHETVQIIDFLLESKEGESLDAFEQEGN